MIGTCDKCEMRGVLRSIRVPEYPSLITAYPSEPDDIIPVLSGLQINEYQLCQTCADAALAGEQSPNVQKHFHKENS